MQKDEMATSLYSKLKTARLKTFFIHGGTSFQMEPLGYRRMDFEEFCAAAISTHQLEAVERWEQIALTAFEHFELEGNRVISVEELARV